MTSIDVIVERKKIENVAADLLVIPWVQGAKRGSDAFDVIDERLEENLTTHMSASHFEGKLGESLVFPAVGRLTVRQVILLGIGHEKSCTADVVRRVGGHIARLAREHKATSVVTALSGVGQEQLDARQVTQALVEGVCLGAYHFSSYKGAQRAKDPAPVRLERCVIIESDARRVGSVKEAARRAVVLAEATMYARDLVNTPSSEMMPQHLADDAQTIAVRGSNITCTVLDQSRMEELGMRAALAVARGSHHPPVGIHLVYAPARAKKKVALVGKAVTFDSGGLSIKPADAMTTMKIDMAGAATVLGVFKALAILKPAIEVHGIFLAVENMPSGTAYRPGDVLKAMDGTTIEVLNTDAEGRVTLADALTYAAQQTPDVVIDVATLTGACVAALGEEIAGLVSNDDVSAKKLLVASEQTGEPLWQLPLFEPYTSLIRSKIADIKNVGGGHGAGAITAALFLKTFIGETPWAHLDIAGPSYTERETRPDQPYGASGYGVRLLFAYLESLSGGRARR